MVRSPRTMGAAGSAQRESRSRTVRLIWSPAAELGEAAAHAQGGGEAWNAGVPACARTGAAGGGGAAGGARLAGGGSRDRAREDDRRPQIGRASCRERVCQYV